MKNGPFTEIVWPHLNHEVRDAVQVELSHWAAKLRHVERGSKRLPSGENRLGDFSWLIMGLSDATFWAARWGFGSILVCF